MSRSYATTGGVTSLNNLTGPVTLVAGDNISFLTSGNSLTISSYGPIDTVDSYTPTLFNTTNVGASTAYTTYYDIEVSGAVVHYWGRVDIDPVALAQTILGMTLAISSSFSSEQQVSGTAAAINGTACAVSIYADVGNANRVIFSYLANSTANRGFTFHLTQRVNQL